MLSPFLDPLGTIDTNMLDPFDVVGFGSPLATTWNNRRQRQRIRRELRKLYTPTWTPTIGRIESPLFTALTLGGNVLTPIEASTGFLSPLAEFGPDVALLDFDRLLTEPLTLGLEDHPKDYRLHIRPQPLIRRQDLHVEVDKGVLTVSGQRTVENLGRTRSVSFSRSVTMPSHVDQDKIEAVFNEDGTLDVKLPKTAGTVTKRVLIKSGDEATPRKESGGGKEDEKPSGGSERDIKIGQSEIFGRKEEEEKTSGGSGNLETQSVQ